MKDAIAARLVGVALSAVVISSCTGDDAATPDGTAAGGTAGSAVGGSGGLAGTGGSAGSGATGGGGGSAGVGGAGGTAGTVGGSGAEAGTGGGAGAGAEAGTDAGTDVSADADVDAAADSSAGAGNGGTGGSSGNGGAAGSGGIGGSAGVGGTPASGGTGGSAGDGGTAGTDGGTGTTSCTTPGLKVFNPADYAASGYDPTGANSSSGSWNAAIKAASAYALANPTATDLYVPVSTANGPQEPQAVVRNDVGVFKLSSVYMQSNVRLEINAASLIIPPTQAQSVAIQCADDAAKGGNSGTTYLEHFTVTSCGSSATFPDTGGLTRTKATRYPVVFPDGTTQTLADKFVIDNDPTRYPANQGTPGNGPRYVGMKIRQARYFLVENALMLANAGLAGHSTSQTQGSNTYPATAAPALAVDSADTQPSTEAAVQARNGTIRHIHGENSTRGYGITEIHAGVDLDWRYVSAVGGMTIRWESSGGGRSTRQNAQQCVSYDGNGLFMMSNHGLPQADLHASFGASHGSDIALRTEGTNGMTTSSTISDVEIFDGNDAQVIFVRDAVDDYWYFGPAEWAIYNNIGVSVTNVNCTGTFTKPDVGGTCL